MWIPSLITTILMLALLYLIAGVIFGLILMVKGLAKLDPATKGSSWSFKVLIFPGIVAFWPWLWKKWRKGS